MTALAKKPTTLGGIGTMLTQSDICPTCGRIHETGLMRYVGRAVAGYPTPTVLPTSTPVGYSPIRDSVPFEVPRRARAIAAPWPMPPIVEEY
jgi:hypothetical protein